MSSSWTRWRRLVAVSGVFIAGATSGFYYHNHGLHFDPSTSIGLVRFSRAALTVSHIAVDYKTSLFSISSDSDEYTRVKSVVHDRSAQRLLELCRLNGGVFIKVGQHVGGLDYLLPQEYTETLKVLHSHAPSVSFSEVRQVIREEFKQELEEVFDSFDPEPVGSASIAQVHKATLKNGQVVAVKVQRQHVRSHSFIDMKTMELLVEIVAKLFPEFKLMWLAEVTKKNLPLELDFVNEAKNMEEVKKMFAHFKWLTIPRVHWELTTPRILTTEFCEGSFVTDTDYISEHNISVSEISQKLGKLYSEMIFVRGYVHCDPHSGNILVRKERDGTHLSLLDHGLYTTLSDDFRMQYAQMWLAILNADVPRIKEHATALGVGDMYGLLACMMTARSWSSVTRGIQKPAADSAAEADEIKRYASTMLLQISQLLNSVPRDMLLLFKTNDLLRGIEHKLKTRANRSSFISMTRCCIRAVADYQKKLCHSTFCRLRINLHEKWQQFEITLYQAYLFCKHWFSSQPYLF